MRAHSKDFIVNNLMFRLYDYTMTFIEAKTLCVDGWEFPTVTQLQEMGNVHYVADNEDYLYGRHNSPKLYWLDGVPNHVFGRNKDTEYDRSSSVSGLYDFELGCCFHINEHQNKSYLILVKKI